MNIIITESQLDVFKRLAEAETPLLNNGSTEEEGDLEKVGTSATITDADGNPKPGKDVYADEITKFQANQDWRGNFRRCIGGY
jgi:hypothetical protein